jgi:hypothetical protein
MYYMEGSSYCTHIKPYNYKLDFSEMTVTFSKGYIEDQEDGHRRSRLRLLSHLKYVRIHACMQSERCCLPYKVEKRGKLLLDKARLDVSQKEQGHHRRCEVITPSTIN